MSDNSRSIIPADNTSEKKLPKIRHVEDEECLNHEDNPEESRLEHEESDGDKNVLQHEESGENASRESENRNTDSKLLKILEAANKIFPDDSEIIGAQAIKHDGFEVPIAILGTINEVNNMRKKGQQSRTVIKRKRQ